VKSLVKITGPVHFLTVSGDLHCVSVTFL